MSAFTGCLSLTLSGFPVSAGPTSDLRKIYNFHREHGTALQIAIAVGVAPALQIAAAADLPRGVADIEVAGALQGKPLELMHCRTPAICWCRPIRSWSWS